MNATFMFTPRKASFEARPKAWWAWIACCVLIGVPSGRTEGTRLLLEYAPGPLDNPLQRALSSEFWHPRKPVCGLRPREFDAFRNSFAPSGFDPPILVSAGYPREMSRRRSCS